MWKGFREGRVVRGGGKKGTRRVGWVVGKGEKESLGKGGKSREVGKGVQEG